eukprot:scaffold1342_cov120-Isochrysis_galbana.AAC.8
MSSVSVLSEGGGAFGFGVVPIGGTVQRCDASPFQGWTAFFVELFRLALCVGRLISCCRGRFSLGVNSFFVGGGGGRGGRAVNGLGLGCAGDCCAVVCTYMSADCMYCAGTAQVTCAGAGS